MVCKKLRDRFDDVALFFYNHLKGTEIGLIWKPAAFLPRTFSLMHCHNHCVCAGGVSDGNTSVLVVDPGNIVAEMLAISEGALCEAVFF